jgi:hypothetical protein
MPIEYGADAPSIAVQLMLNEDLVRVARDMFGDLSPLVERAIAEAIEACGNSRAGS